MRDRIRLPHVTWAYCLLGVTMAYAHQWVAATLTVLAAAITLGAEEIARAVAQKPIAYMNGDLTVSGEHPSLINVHIQHTGQNGVSVNLPKEARHG